VNLEIRPVETFEEAQPENVIEVEVRKENVYSSQVGWQLLAQGQDSGASIQDHRRVRRGRYFYT
jgi:hypothetical protein